jgi:hypothetical protein
MVIELAWPNPFTLVIMPVRSPPRFTGGDPGPLGAVGLATELGVGVALPVGAVASLGDTSTGALVATTGSIVADGEPRPALGVALAVTVPGRDTRITTNTPTASNNSTITAAITMTRR